MKKTSLFILSFLAISFFWSCNNDDNNSTQGSLTLTFDNTISTTQDLTLGVNGFSNSNNESINVSELKYIISNIVLIDENNNEFAYPKADSYRVINELDANSRTLTLNNIPVRNYTKIKFGLGVDPEQYPLDQLENFVPEAEETGMLWAWAAGYKFIKFEGMYTPNGGTPTAFIYHVGSHGTNQDNYKEVTLSFPNAATVNNTITPTITITATIPQIFDGVNTIALTGADNVQVDPARAPAIAQNFSAIFSASDVQN